MFGSFTCTRNSLIGLNILYMIVAFLLIGVATYGKTSSIITSLNVVGGIVACGVFLLFIALLGIVGAMKHHQVYLFFYMVVLFLLFLIQFSVACACLAVNKEQQHALALFSWRHIDNATKMDAQEHFQCCGFETTINNASDSAMSHPPCPTPKCCPDNVKDCCMGVPCACDPCYNMVQAAMQSGLRASGGIGLFFSFTELFGVWVTWRFRHQKDPRHAPSSFL